MIVTDKQYDMEKKYIEKLDLMIKRMNGADDNVLIIDGDEGQGKTELAFGTCYYVSYMSKRKYNIDNVFFDLEKMIEFASKTEKQIIHYDEAAFGLLLTQWQSKVQQQFIQLVMTARKKKHFIVICIPKFHRLPQYVIEERSIGLVHVYSRRNLQKGRFCYFKKDAKDRLYQDWVRKRTKTYRKHYTFHGTFVEASKKIFTPEQMQEYENKKDEAIAGITNVKEKRVDKATLQRNKMLYIMRTHFKMTTPQLEKLFKQYKMDIDAGRIREWAPLNSKII